VDVAGRAVWSLRQRIEARGTILIDRPDLAPGMYALSVLSNGRTIEKRVIIN
jgi:hypothetical protein